MRIEIISGSPRAGSLSRRVALHLKEELSRQAEATIGLIDMQTLVLSPVQEVWRRPEDVPPHLRSVAHRFLEADAYVLVSPEYKGSYSPALKNFLDHFPKRDRKVFGVVTASPGSLGGIRAALQLQSLVDALFGIGSPKMLIVPAVDVRFRDDGTPLDPPFKSAVGTFTDDFLWLARTMTTAARKETLLVA